MLGGVSIECDFGLVSETDGDVVLHALADAALAAAGEPDIGMLFPAKDPRFAGRPSSELVVAVKGRVTERGLKLEQVDVTILAELPLLSGHYGAMRERIGELVGLSEADVSVKARTCEGLGTIGSGKAIAATVIVMGVITGEEAGKKNSVSDQVFESKFPLEHMGEIPRGAMVVNVDGGSRGNPGPAAAGAVCRNASGEVIFSEGKFLGTTTNNVAEYEGVRLGLSLLAERDLLDAKIVICLDSSLVFNQLIGRYRIKDARLRELAREILGELKSFNNLRFKLVPREDNQVADEVANRLLDDYSK
jgi:2-C-methyl-D-erythritol 2,4-cyclodiphosphate synthase